MTGYEGVWISPDRETIPVVEHLIKIQEDPEVFGLDSKFIRRLNVEGLRRVAEDLIKNGWIRYRYLSGAHLFEMYKLDQGVIDDVLIKARIPAELQDDERVFIQIVRPRREYRGTVSEWYDRSMLRSWESNPKRAWRFSR